MISTTLLLNGPGDPWELLRQAINELSKLLEPVSVSWSELPKTKEDHLPRTLRNGWQDSLRILSKSARGTMVSSRKIPRWIMQCTCLYKAVGITEECL